MTEPYRETVECDCCQGGRRPFINGEGRRQECPYCDDAGTRRVLAPHPSHKLTDWNTELLSPNGGEPRFYRVRHCINCEEQEWSHPAGRFLHKLTFQCKEAPRA